MRSRVRYGSSVLLPLVGSVGILLVAAACGDDAASPSSPVDDLDAAPGADAGEVTDAADASTPDARPDSGPALYSIRVAVAGLALNTADAGLDDAGSGGLVLQNGSEKITITKNGSYAFTTKVLASGTYDVTVASQPTNPLQSCTVAGGKGTVVSGDVTSITVNCAPQTFTIGGHVSGLAGSGLRLRINDTENVDVNIVDGTYAFATPLASGTPYSVVVDTSPTNRWQTCTLANETGLVDDANIENVDVTCADRTFVVSGTISGLTTSGLSLVNTYTGGGGPETIAPPANATSFAFTQAVRSGESYAVTVAQPPTGFLCNVTNGSGAVAGADITNVSIGCTQAEWDFAFTGAAQLFVVPTGASALDVTLEGAQGGTDYGPSHNYGGKLTATLPVTVGESLSIFVGGQPADISGGFNGGGAGENAGRGGGGATDIRRGGSALANRILVAAGGGGGGVWGTAGGLEVVGGEGGGETGNPGFRVPDYGSNPGGQGATQTASGTGTCVSFNNPSVSGGFGFGGAPSGCGCQGYGGGGGWYGGAGSGNCRGGGGGSAYAATTEGITNVVHTVGGGRPGNGHVHIVAK